ncbi:acetyltransferase [Ectobacillus antri]|jgi:acetyltransferase EpsM|uniref:Acetyltransferase n=1 Tax=Ectobacillus antri TaxID=2486280 RepID=A0ABT6H2S9_9BACI|nr:acetyltransferase [Ectobacillus antri]MDG4658054.1 acetyltransferase [Ectobacillus antri]MDG5753705.1 acetyltransferase [Ectobacillus antri]
MKLVLIGAGGHSKAVRDVIHSTEHTIVACLDDCYKELYFKNNMYFGPISAVKAVLLIHPDAKLVIALEDNGVRKNIMRKLMLSSNSYATIIHQQAVISSSAKIGQGTVIMPGAVINADAIVGDHVIINTRAVVEHDNVVEDFAHISPGAVLAGGVGIKQGVHIGANATVLPNILVGEWTTVGAGAVVVTNMPSYVTAVGVPATVIKTKMVRDI